MACQAKDLRQRVQDADAKGKDADAGTLSQSEETQSNHIKVVESKEELKDFSKVNIGSIRAALPAEVFVKSLRRSLQWMVWDMGVVMVMLYVTKRFVWEGAWLSAAQSWCVLPLCWAVTGFFMWAIFVVGHDCGHTTFSNFPAVNHFCGWLSHGSILVPWSAWARSHHFHHLYHNHVDKDYSFPWCHEPKLDGPMVEFLDQFPKMRAMIFPIFGYLAYLGLPVVMDGCHYLPGVFGACRLWKGASFKVLALGWIDTVVVLSYLKFFYVDFFYGGSWTDFACLYLPCWFVFCFMLFTVTYLQHHNPTTKVYDDSTFNYTYAAFETVDRKYGGPIDMLHHHISDCHVVHHLFFTKIPHYNLRKATDALVAYLEKEGLSHLYRLDSTPDFCWRVFKYMHGTGMRAVLVTADKVWGEKLKAATKKAA